MITVASRRRSRRSARLAFMAALAAAFLTASVARADPCKAIPDHGPTPPNLRAGAEFSGRVVYVGDGDSLCVGALADQSTWIEVRLADFYAPELHAPGGLAAKRALERVAMGRDVRCRAGRRSYDRVVALCRVRGERIGDLLRRAGAVEGGNGVRAGRQ